MNTIGYLGSMLILVAYAIHISDAVSKESKWYLLLNLFGCVFTGVYALWTKTYPLFILQFVWCIISVFGLYKIFLKTECSEIAKAEVKILYPSEKEIKEYLKKEKADRFLNPRPKTRAKSKKPLTPKPRIKSGR